MVLHLMRMHGVASPARLARMLSARLARRIPARTVVDDVAHIREDGANWTGELALFAWEAKCRQMYIETNEEIDALRTLMLRLARASSDVPPEVLDGIAALDLPEKEKARLADEVTKTYEAVAPTRTAGKAAYLQSAIIQSREFLNALATDMPLYQRTQRLAEFYESHKDGVAPAAAGV